MKKLLWILWLVLTLALAVYYYITIFESDDKTELLIGDTTYGHYQIEMECSACHLEPFGGKDVLQDACTNCHQDELDDAHDSHPKKKFTDPREAYRLEIIDARYCVSCHTEHHNDRTHTMGVTLPDDYCYNCHKEVGEERESHKDLTFDSCATSGCHNFHDNRALYEAFLVANANQPWLHEVAKIAAPNAASTLAKAHVKKSTNNRFAKKLTDHATETHEWQASSHAMAGVTCAGCHTDSKNNEWIDRPAIAQCTSCHEQEVTTYKSGKHGMRLSIEGNEKNIQPNESHLAFQSNALETEHGCNSCHGAHSFDTQKAAVDRCLNCHADDHSTAFKNSPHGQLLAQTEENSINNGAVVTCATCHMPRLEKNINGNKVITVDHNQNNNLRPNEKMIRPVCMNCHGLGFSIDALADPELIKNNFNGKPGIHIESIDWSIKRVNK